MLGLALAPAMAQSPRALPVPHAPAPDPGSGANPHAKAEFLRQPEEETCWGLCRRSPQPAPFLSQSGKDKDAIDKVFKNLDENGDSQVDFKEFVIFVAALTSCCHNYFEQNAAK